MFGSFIKPTNSLLAINKLYIPLEVCDIIKNYLYYDINSLKFIKELTKQKKELKLIKSAWSRNNMPLWTHIEKTEENSEHWIFGFTRSYNNNTFESLQLQGENCYFCGEFKLITIWKRKGSFSNMKLCHC